MRVLIIDAAFFLVGFSFGAITLCAWGYYRVTQKRKAAAAGIANPYVTDQGATSGRGFSQYSDSGTAEENSKGLENN